MILTPHPTWKKRDSSKFDDYQTCPRKFFFTHLLGWRLDQPSHDTYFGESWHRARAYQLLFGYDKVAEAYLEFLDYYRKEFPPETDDLYRPKDPIAVSEALNKFADERQNDLEENEIVILDGKKMIEIAGTVPIAEDRVLYYRLDSILQRKADDKIFSWDHKSAKRISRQWRDKFYLSIQNGTYTHCLYCMFPIEQVIGVEFCGTCFEYLVKGSYQRPAGYHVSFERVPAFKTPDQMNVWLWNVNKYWDDLDRDMQMLDECQESDPVMMAFQQRTISCTAYYGCAFHDFCMAWPNPLQNCYEPPLGFKVEFWDPESVEAKEKKNLKWR